MDNKELIELKELVERLRSDLEYAQGRAIHSEDRAVKAEAELARIKHEHPKG